MCLEHIFKKSLFTSKDKFQRDDLLRLCDVNDFETPLKIKSALYKYCHEFYDSFHKCVRWGNSTDSDPNISIQIF